MLLNGLMVRLKWLGVFSGLFLIAGCGSLAQKSLPEVDDVSQVESVEDQMVEAAKPIPEGEIRGSVSYRERIALLPGTFVRVVLIQQGLKAEPPQEIAEQIFHPAGQVPFRYRLKFSPEDIRGGFRYVVKGQIFSEDERLLFASKTAVELEPLGPDREIDLPLSRVPITHQSHMKPVTAAISRVFQCGDFAFGSRTGIGEIALYLPDEVLVLSQIRSASGVRYQEGDTLFWMKGDQAMLSYQGTFYRQCLRNTSREARDPVERRPVDFRALGDQPPWLLEVVSGHNINLITQYGQKRVQLPEPEMIREGDRVIFRAKDLENRISATLRKQACHRAGDSAAMAGSESESSGSVSVWWNGQHYEGCGAFLTK
ncbi:MAG: YbaY family lipoprotein [Oceanospirillum sp.]|nr:YbaY family lipoprotein [Oceanospirillum sp.]